MDGVLAVQDDLVRAAQLRHQRHRAVQHQKLEAAHLRGAVDRILSLLRWQLPALEQVAHDLAQVDVHALVVLEAEVELYAENIVRAKRLDLIVHRVWLVEHMHTQKPVGAGALGILIEDGVECVAIDRLHIVAAADVDKVLRQLRQCTVAAQRGKILRIVTKLEAHAVFLLELRAAVPDDHNRQKQQRHNDRHIAAVRKFRQAREEKHRLDRAEDNEHAPRERFLPSHTGKIHEQKQRCHQHRHRDGKAIGRLHARARAEQQHDERAARPEDLVDRVDVDLTLGLGGILHLQVRHQVEADGLRYQRIGACDESLRGDDRRECAQNDRHRTQRAGQHQKERVQALKRCKRRVAPTAEQPRPLPQIVEDQADLDERPADVNALAADMAHVGIQRLRARRGQKHAAEDHKAEFIIRAHEKLHRVRGVERPEHLRHGENVHRPRRTEEEEPHEHHRAKGLADAARARVLHGKKRRDDAESDDDDARLAASEEPVHHRDTAKSLNRRGHGHRRRQHAVGKQRRAAKHRRHDEPLAAAAHERIEREDTALAVVVRLHGDEHVLDGREQRDRPDDERQRADNERLVDLRDAAVPLQNGLHHVQR